MKLIIAEKPSLALDIATALEGKKPKKTNGYYELNNGDKVTWLYGHMYEQYMPADYDKKYKVWSISSLPIIPEKWGLKVKDDVKSHMVIIKQLLKKADLVVHAGDPDREGQLLVDELLEECRFNGKVERIWITDKTKIKESYEKREDNRKFKNYSLSALSRSRSDWLVGINFTRAFTIKFASLGGKGVLNVGRVVTPTLNIIVEREKEIRNFKSKDYYELFGIFNSEGGKYKGKLIPSEEITDFEGYVLNKQDIENIIKKIEGQEGKVIDVQKRTNKTASPMPFTLDTLQKYCSTKFKIGAKQTLDIAQSLYEKYKVTTYPRTESPYLSDGQFQEAPEIFKNIEKQLDLDLSKANFNKKHAVFNDSKLDAHFGIIPTGGGTIKGMNDLEKKVYHAIVNRYLGCFYPDKVTETMKIKTEIEGEVFTTNYSKVIELGWSALDGGKLDEEIVFPIISKGDNVSLIETTIETKKTKPPARFDEGGLITAMKQVAKFVKNPKIKQKLKETSGLGTSATRGDIVEKLKKSGLIKIGTGKKIFAEKKGEDLIDLLPSKITDPGMSAIWEDGLSMIEKGELSLDEFLNKQITWVEQVILKTLDGAEDVLAKPSEKALKFAESISKVLEIDLPEEIDRTSIKNFIDTHIEEYKSKNISTPTEAQINLAKRIAETLNIELPNDCFTSMKACSNFIDKNKIPPSDKQISFAEKLAEEKDIELPKDYKIDRKVCSEFIEKQLGKREAKTKKNRSNRRK